MTIDRTVHPLMRRYPQFFDMDKPGHGLIDGMFTTGSGWDGLLSTLFLKLARLGLPAEFRIEQVKEKHGLLRVYHNEQTGAHGAAVEKAIDDAESTSAVTCELCGSIASLTEEHGNALTQCTSCQQRRSET